VVHCSTAPEPFGRVIVEGMMARKPVIAAKAGGALEIVSNEENGLLVGPGDPEALAGAVERLSSDAHFAGRLAKTGYESAYRRFAIDSIVREIENHIRKVLGIPDVIDHPETSATPA
jgi:glycosyltransferase involved in cell wall biosynthesis